MSRGTLSPERSNHRRIVSADECCVVRSRICRDRVRQISRFRGSKGSAGRTKTTGRGHINWWHHGEK